MDSLKRCHRRYQSLKTKFHRNRILSFLKKSRFHSSGARAETEWYHILQLVSVSLFKMHFHASENHCFEESRVKGMMKTQLTLYFIPTFEFLN